MLVDATFAHSCAQQPSFTSLRMTPLWKGFGGQVLKMEPMTSANSNAIAAPPTSARASFQTLLRLHGQTKASPPKRKVRNSPV